MSNTALEQEISKEELTRRGMVMIFLSAIGGKENLDFVIKHPEQFWKQNWNYTTYHLRDWITRATQLPLSYFVLGSWERINCDARDHIVKKTKEMAIRAKTINVGG